MSFDNLLEPQGGYAHVSAEIMEQMGKEAANLFLKEGIPLNESISKLASSYHNFNSEQVKRVVGFANNAAYLGIHEKNKISGANSSYPQFELADPAKIIQDLGDGARPTVITKTDVDYATPPIEKTSSSVEDLVSQLFGETTDHEPESRESILNSLTKTKYKLAGLLDSLVSSHERFDLLLKEASQDYYHTVRNHLLNGGSFTDVVASARSNFETQEDFNDYIQPVVVKLLKEKISSPQKLTEEIRGIEKVAHRVVNPTHPLVCGSMAIKTITEELVKTSMAIDNVSAQLAKVENFIKEAFHA